MIGSWPSPSGGEEYAVTFDRGRARRLLVLPALFDEHNKLRHFTVEVMRRLDAAGIDSFLPDLPGCNESVVPLEMQTVSTWRQAAQAAASHFDATHGLSIRGGALCEPALPCVRYATVAGGSVLRGMLRARVIASKEAGLHETSEALAERGRREGLELAGYRLSPIMIAELESAEPQVGKVLVQVAQGDLGGPALWLRAEPCHDGAQADTLAALVAKALA